MAITNNSDAHDRISSYKKPNPKAADGILMTLEELGYDVDKARTALEEFEGIERGDFDSKDEYAEAREDAWNEFVSAVEDIEDLDPDEPTEDELAELDAEYIEEVEDLEDPDGGDEVQELEVVTPAPAKKAKTPKAEATKPAGDEFNVAALVEEVDADAKKVRTVLRSLAKDNTLFARRDGETSYSWSKKEFAQVVKAVKKALQA